MKRRRKTKQIQQVATATGGQPFNNMLVTEQPDIPSAFMASVATSGSLAVIGVAFAYSYNFSYQTLLPLISLPWFIYALGKLAYLIILLISDITNLFEPADQDKKMLAITKE